MQLHINSALPIVIEYLGTNDDFAERSLARRPRIDLCTHEDKCAFIGIELGEDTRYVLCNVGQPSLLAVTQYGVIHTSEAGGLAAAFADYELLQFDVEDFNGFSLIIEDRLYLIDKWRLLEIDLELGRIIQEGFSDYIDSVTLQEGELVVETSEEVLNLELPFQEPKPKGKFLGLFKRE